MAVPDSLFYAPVRVFGAVFEWGPQFSLRKPGRFGAGFVPSAQFLYTVHVQTALGVLGLCCLNGTALVALSCRVPHP